MQLIKLDLIFVLLLTLLCSTNYSCAQSFRAIADTSLQKVRIKLIPESTTSLSDLISEGITVSDKAAPEGLLLRPILHQYSDTSNFNSMDFYVRNLLADISALDSGNDIILGLYLLNSIYSPENNKSSGLYLELEKGMLESLEVNSRNGIEKVKIEYNEYVDPSSIFEDFLVSKNIVQLNWRHDQNVGWIYYIEEKIKSRWTKMSPVIPYRNTSALSYSFDLIEGKQKEVRLVARNIFGERIIIKDDLIFMGTDINAPQDVDDLKVNVDSLGSDNKNSKIVISSEYKGIDADTLKYFTSFYPDSAFELVKTISGLNMSKAVILKVPQGQRWIYVKCVATDRAGNESPGVIEYKGIPDFYPPPVLQSLNAQIDSLGSVSLTWDESVSSDLFGYLVESSTSENGEFQKVTSSRIVEPFYQDTLALDLNNNRRFYRVAAIDKNMNIGDYSSVVGVLARDTIKPAFPVLIRVEVDSSTHTLIWKNGYEDDVELLAICSSLDGVKWETTVLDNIEMDRYTFEERKSGNWYYKMFSIDRSSNYSMELPPRSVVQFDKKAETKVNKLATIINEDRVDLNWSSTALNVQYLIFQSINGGSFLVAKSSSATYDSIAIPPGAKKLSYFVRAQNEEGDLSEKSNISQISIP